MFSTELAAIRIQQQIFYTHSSLVFVYIKYAKRFCDVTVLRQCLIATALVNLASIEFIYTASVVVF
jgi:hypothetical protein